MSDQGVRYIVRIDGIEQAKAGLMSMEGYAQRAEAGIASLNSTLRGLAGTLGVGFGAAAVVDFGKSIIDVGGNMEQLRFMMKIASKDSADYAANMKLAKHAVDDFKLPIEETYKSWGALIASIKGTDMAGAPIRGMFEDMARLFAVMPINADAKGRAFYAIREMFEEQVVQTRHFVRQLSIAIPGILPMAEQLTGTTGAQFKKMLREKDPNKQINPAEFLPQLFRGLSEQFATVENMNEQMGNIAPNVVDIKNKWIEFKDELATKLKPEIIGFFDELKGGIGWLKDHEDGIISTGKALVKITEVWAAYKIGMGIVSVATTAYTRTATLLTGEVVTQTAAYESETLAVNALAIAMERLIYVQASANGMPTLAAMSAANAARMGGTGVIAAEAGGIGALSSVISGGALVVGGVLLYGIYTALKEFTDNFGKEPASDSGKYFLDNDNEDQLQLLGNGTKGLSGKDYLKKLNELYPSQLTTILGIVGTNTAAIPEMLKEVTATNESIRKFADLNPERDSYRAETFSQWMWGLYRKTAANIQGPGGAAGKIVPTNDKVTGHGNVYHFHVGKVIGIETQTNTITPGMGKAEIMGVLTRDLPEAVRSEIMAVLNDGQVQTATK